MARRKFRYQGISRTIFVPVAAAPTVFVGPFTSFGSPFKTAAKVAIVATAFAGFVAPSQPVQAGPFTQFSAPPAKPQQQVGWNNSPTPVQVQTSVFTKFSQPPAPKNNIPDEQPSALFEVAPPPIVTIEFTIFSQPQLTRILIPDEQPGALFEVLPPQPSPFTGFARFETLFRAKANIALFGDFKPSPIVIPTVDTHDGVWVKWKKKRGPDPIELELAEKASRRAALELAIYGPEVEYTNPAPVFESPEAPVNVAELAKVVAQAQAAHHQAVRAQADQDEETELESILREIL